MELTNGHKWAIIIGAFALGFTVLGGGMSHLNKIIDHSYVTRSYMNAQLDSMHSSDFQMSVDQMRGCEDILAQVEMQQGK